MLCYLSLILDNSLMLAMPQVAHCLQRYRNWSGSLLITQVNVVPVEGIILCFITGVWVGFYVKLMLVTAWMKTVYNCLVLDLLPGYSSEMFHLQNIDFLFDLFCWLHLMHSCCLLYKLLKTFDDAQINRV